MSTVSRVICISIRRLQVGGLAKVHIKIKSCRRSAEILWTVRPSQAIIISVETEWFYLVLLTRTWGTYRL